MIRTTFRPYIWAVSLVMVLGVAACGTKAPSASPTTPRPTVTASPSVPSSTDAPDVPCPGSGAELWRTHLTGPLSDPAQAAGLPFLLIGDGAVLRSLTACGGEEVDSLELDGAVAQRPVVVRLTSRTYAAFVTTASGTAYKVDIAGDGTLDVGWERDLRRAECPADRFAAAPAVGRDAVFVATDRQCGASLDNQVVALGLTDGAVRWTFNQSGAQDVGAVRSAPVLDPSGNRLLVGTAGPSGTPTLYSLNALTGTRHWSVDAGALRPSPLVTADRIFTADQQGTVRAWSPAGESLWSVRLSPGTVQGLVDFGAIDVVESVILVSVAGAVVPVTYDGVAQPRLALPGGAMVATTPLAQPAESRLYVGSTDPGVWQLGIFGEVEGRHDLDGTGPTCCLALVTDGDQVNLVTGTASGDLVKLMLPLAT